MQTLRGSLVFTVSMGLILGFSPPEARACGGTFCDQPAPGQPAMPVDQSGENILFVMAQGQVEAHIQIQYTGEPERFAWLIPVPKEPELFVGSERLFRNLLGATVPRFTLTSGFRFCGGDGESRSVGCGMSSDDSAAGAGTNYGPGGGGKKRGDAPQVIGQKSVGAFETTTLAPSTTQELITWLTDNGFDPDEKESAPILKDYITRGYRFVAVKLRPAAGSDEIHPLVLRYPGDEPCVPIKLTRIAAVDDMSIRTFFLGDRRVVPTNFKHVTLNPVRLEYRAPGANYNLAVSRAVDAPVANGRAFLTEYAGVSSTVSRDGLVDGRWQNVAFAKLNRGQAIFELKQLGLLSCSGSTSCSSPHPLVFPLLERYLPAPDGVTPASYYSCPSCYPEGAGPWEAEKFQSDFSEMVVNPGVRAQQILQNYPYLTRMLTRISPEEMVEDPMFKEWPTELPDVTNAYSAMLTQSCGGTWVTELPDGREVYGGSTSGSPVLPAEMPWATLIEEYSESGQHTVLVDHKARIDQQLASFNEPLRQREPGETSESSGCGCSVPSTGSGYAFWAFGFVALLLTRRRFRR